MQLHFCRLAVFLPPPSVYSERSLQRVASMASRAERGEHSALCDGVVDARRAGALQAKRVVFQICSNSPRSCLLLHSRKSAMQIHYAKPFIFRKGTTQKFLSLRG